ncbi:MAG: hypothetical protein DVB27_08475 [Verrucomicrobia bacterium]|nr:MAG: hypothetical protein DVB27_08475 [Verrucomicrobiota bacterium]
MFKSSPLQFAVALTLFAAGSLTSHAQDAGALVDKLVKKGVLSSQEGEEVRADMMRDFATQTPAGKINLNSSITELKLYGDLRVRYQYDDREAQVAAPNHVDQRSRFRYRLRLGADVALGENWFAGFQLQSGQNADSANQTFSNGFDNDGIFISKAFFGFKNDWSSIVVGKQKNPFYTTDMVWDPDINPAGVVETIAFHKLFNGGAEVTNSNWELSLVAGQLFYSDNNEFSIGTDLKTDGYLFVEQLIGTYRFSNDVSVTIAPAYMTFTASHLVGLRNESPFSDANNVLSTTTTQTTATERNRLVVNYDAAGNITGGTLQPFTVTATQVSSPTTTTVKNGSSTGSTTRTVTTDQVRNGATVNLTAAQAKAQAASLGLAATGPANGQTQRDIDGVGVTTTNTVTLPAITGETRKLSILTAPGDISFKIGSLKTKVYWDFAYNLDGADRFNDIYQLRTGRPGTDAYRGYKTRDGIAWLAGVQVGETKKKGDWSLNFNYRESGIASIDPNLNDSDFALSELNTRGFKLSLAYQLADVVVVNLTGMMAWNLDRNLSGGRATGSTGVAQDNAINVVQFDVNVKF